MFLNRENQVSQITILFPWDGTCLVFVDETDYFCIIVDIKLWSIFHPQNGVRMWGSSGLEFYPDHVVLKLSNGISLAANEIFEKNV